MACRLVNRPRAGSVSCISGDGRTSRTSGTSRISRNTGINYTNCIKRFESLYTLRKAVQGLVAIRISIPRVSGFKGWAGDPLLRAALVVFLAIAVVAGGLFTYFWVSYEKMIDARMSGQIFANSARIYGRPTTVKVGDAVTPRQIGETLRHAGYVEAGTSAGMGSFQLVSGGIEVRPGPESYHKPEAAHIHVSAGKVSAISTDSEASLDSYELEPQLITSLSDTSRAKRQVVTYQEIPKQLVDATLAIEDRRFFSHSGINYFRLIQAATIDVITRRHEQGGSTLTMQLSRGFFLSPEKTVRRKLAEMMIATQLEHRYSKDEIFALYANEVPLGQRGSFAVAGFAEAARTYFNKDLKDITLPEAALLAGMIQRPSYLSPYRHPERALARRNLVLEAMADTGAITQPEADKAKAAPLKLAAPNVEASDAPYFVDLVKDQLANQFNERELNEQALRIFTTLDPDLQKAAAAAIEEGTRIVDAQVNQGRSRRVKGANGKMESQTGTGPEAQMALVAIDPHTGEVLALVGGRNYGTSQLNHAIAKRPTGSIFKPFVYAAAMSSAVGDSNATGTVPAAPPSGTVFTPSTILDDAQTTFTIDDKVYEPRNYKNEYHGQVTALYALQHSLNNATVKLAEMVGYGKVTALAHAAGISSVQSVPAAALGSFSASPLDMAGAYTVFANAGTRQSTYFIRSVQNSQGEVLSNSQSEAKSVLDARVAAIMTTLMQGVINNGTGSTVRARGFSAPAAGKTGTSHDGWFAGYTNNLLCIVWVGFDDYSDLKLAGGATAAPIWAEFMKRAQTLPQYRNMGDFAQPEGVINVAIEKNTGLLPTASCPETYPATFVAGTEPRLTCDQAPPPSLPPTPEAVAAGTPTEHLADGSDADPASASEQKKRGILSKIGGIFKKEKKPRPSEPQPPQPETPR